MKIFPSTKTGDELQLSLYDYWYIIQKRKRLAITFFLIAVISTALYSLLSPKIYKATTRILIERSNQNILSFDNIFPVQTAGLDYYPTQYKILRSRSIAKRVMDELHLWPQFSWASDPPAAFLQKVDIDPVKQSRLVDVSAYSTSPKQAADMANAVVRFYIEQNLNNKLVMTQQAAEWLKGRSKDVKENLSQSELEFEVVKLKKELAELNEKYLPKHPKIIRTEERIRVIEQKLGGDVSQKINEGGEISTQYNQLQREVDSQGKIYEAMLSRLKETSASEGIEDTNVVVIDRAEVPVRPVAPRLFLNIFLSILVGGFGAAALCLIFESLDNTVKAPEDIEKLGELPLLGVVSHWEAVQKQLIVHEDRSSGVAEGFRAIRTSLLFSSPDHPLRTLMITSPFAEEGKTVIACNLAVTIAQSGARVLLVDADMRRPRVNRVFQQNGVHGLSHALTDSANVANFIQKTEIENLWVLFCGPLPPTPSELVGSQKMRQLVEKLKEQFDYVLFDSPPFLVVTDPVVLSTYVDGVIMVARYNKTPKDVISRGKQKFLSVQAKLAGVILNDVDFEQERYRYPAYSYYHDPVSEKETAGIPSLVAKVASDQASAVSSRPSRNFSPK